jgi:hypothetical protein
VARLEEAVATGAAGVASKLQGSIDGVSGGFAALSTRLDESVARADRLSKDVIGSLDRVAAALPPALAQTERRIEGLTSAVVRAGSVSGGIGEARRPSGPMGGASLVTIAFAAGIGGATVGLLQWMLG